MHAALSALRSVNAPRPGPLGRAITFRAFSASLLRMKVVTLVRCLRTARKMRALHIGEET